MANIEKLAIELATKFINLPYNKIDNHIEYALKHIVTQLGFDRSTLFQLCDGSFISTHVWARPGIPRRVGVPLTKTLAYTASQIISTRKIQAFTVRTLPEDAIEDRRLMESAYGPRFIICIPLLANNRPIGAMCIGSFNIDHKTTPALFKHLRLLSTILAHALLKKELEKKAHEVFDKIKEEKHLIEEEKKILVNEVNKIADQSQELVGGSGALRKVRALIRQVAATDSTVLICGETGTGKELVARQIHKLSRRGNHAMFAVNCATLSSELVESRLFGHEKGAFTGATRLSRGLFEIATNSSLFLDEVGELDLSVQAKLLRVLQEKQFERLGSPVCLQTHARIITATNKNLEEAVKNTTFRSDLYYRLNVFPIYVPPLRERSEDIPAIISSMIERFNMTMGKRVNYVRASDMDILTRYPYPGNIRELSNIIEHAFILTTGETLKLPNLPNLQQDAETGELAPQQRVAPTLPDAAPEPPMTLLESERRCILNALRMTKGQVSGKNGAAALLDINAKTLDSRMRKLGIKRKHSGFE